MLGCYRLAVNKLNLDRDWHVSARPLSQNTTDCSYLKNLTPIGFLTEGEFEPYKEDVTSYTDEMKNPLFYWLKEKISFHVRQTDLGESPLHSVVAKIAGDIQ